MLNINQQLCAEQRNLCGKRFETLTILNRYAHKRIEFIKIPRGMDLSKAIETKFLINYGSLLPNRLRAKEKKQFDSFIRFTQNVPDREK